MTGRGKVACRLRTAIETKKGRIVLYTLTERVLRVLPFKYISHEPIKCCLCRLNERGGAIFKQMLEILHGVESDGQGTLN